MIHRAIIKFTGTTEIEFEEFYDAPPSDAKLRDPDNDGQPSETREWRDFDKDC